MIEAHELTTRYGDTIAVHSLSFTIAPGTVTGFLGPNGAGKSTTMRMIMGLDRPTSGTVTVNGKPCRQHRSPLREAGGLLEASAVHPGRSARSHLRTMAATHNIKASRVSEVIEMTGLAGVAAKRVAGFSLGMGQRLGIAAALLGDPRTLILDEPVNGPDPEGVQWARQLVRALAAEARTVFLSSHLMSEISQTAGHLLVTGRGRIIAAGPVQQVIDSVAGGAVRARSPRAGELAAAPAADGATVTPPETGMLDVSGTTAALPDSLTQCSHTGRDATASTPGSASSAISTSRSTHDSQPTCSPVRENHHQPGQFRCPRNDAKPRTGLTARTAPISRPPAACAHAPGQDRRTPPQRRHTPPDHRPRPPAPPSSA